MIIYIDFMNRRYRKLLQEKEMPPFKFWDDYALFLFEDICDKDEEKYYQLLEEDTKVFSDYQTGTERELERYAKLFNKEEL